MARPPADGGSAAAHAGTIDYSDLMPKEEDLLYEEELLRTPHVTKLWTRYLEARKDATAKRRYLIFERAVKALPGSYKVRSNSELRRDIFRFGISRFAKLP